ncbi:TatD family hydrolase [Mucilaginibacter arboris]|uniref:YchF/TatD family DNA exonuclease n=1 Tax=Mucilaginibacter arboris TaxID=2682090 RepID=A0A7K1SVZ6_9SPHI|nr:TatD family hydrolase [Mucilaginibacter arboris]MVN21495.1 YchF/TatD family DNA exonuclease [Mucilaginibacter arboris]
MVLTDTHTHLYYEADEAARNAMMQRCLDNQITRLFLPNVDAASVPMIADLVKTYPQYCFPMLGLHPCSVTKNWETELQAVKESWDNNQKIYAVGEIGIDLYWEQNLLKEQQKAFSTQINWAKEANLPIVIHCRAAFNEVYSILKEESSSNLRGIFHCFSGDLEQANQIIELGLYLGIGGVVTYKNAGLDKVVQQIGLEHLVLETDSPYLPPVPFRGKPNESAYLTYIAQKVADLHQQPVKKIAEITTLNSEKVFGI